MSYCASTLEACPTLQAQIDEHFQTCDSGLHVEDIPMAEFIAAGANNLTRTIYPGNGKVRTIDLLYDQLILPSAVTVGATEFCTATTKRGNCSQQYTIDTTDNLTIEQVFEADDFTEACVDNGAWIARNLTKMLLALEHRIADKWIPQALLLSGAWNTTDIPETVNGSGELEIPVTLDGSGGGPNPAAFNTLYNDLKLNGYCAPTMIAGGTTWQRYAELTGNAGCCTDTGLDISAIYAKWGMAIAYDRRVKNSMGGATANDKALVVQQGAIIPLWWVKHTWRDGVAVPSGGSNYVNYGLVTPRLRVPVDVYFSDKCPGELHFVLSAVTNLVGLPEDLFPTGYHLDGVKYVNKLLAKKCVDLCP